MASLLQKKEVEKVGVIEGNLIIPFKIYPDGKRYYGKPYESIKGQSKGKGKDRVGKRVGGTIETKNSGSFKL